MRLKLDKVHGSGNTFYLLDWAQPTTLDWGDLAKWICHSSNSGGADGLLLVLPSKVADAKMRVINADGSEASMCGNGLRCVARYVCEKQGIDEAIIETMRANLSVRKEASIFGSLPTFAVEISPVSFELETLPMAIEGRLNLQHELVEEFSPRIPFTAVSVPNPHLIGIVNEHYIVHKSHQFLLAQYLNGSNPFCPDGVNVSYVLPMSENEIFVRTYERGVGFTNACGTAMTASALVAKQNDYVTSRKVTVYNPGGFVQCIVDVVGETYHLTLVGNATVIANIELAIEDGQYAFTNYEETDESLQYVECLKFVTNKTDFFVK